MFTTKDKEFVPYGYTLEGDFSDLIAALEGTKIPEEGNLYVRDDTRFHGLPGFSLLKEKVFPNVVMESGYCNGNNKKLNCLEYHACPEVDLAVRDLVLLLALPSDIHDGVVDSKDVKAFLIHRGEAVVLHPYVMHFSPCMKDNVPFICGIFLEAPTNEDLDEPSSDPLLWKKNKWLLAHKESKQASLGAHIGIKGENITVE